MVATRRWKRVSPASSGWNAVAITFFSRTATIRPSSSRASTSTSGPISSMIGARMKIAWTGVSPRIGTGSWVSKESSWRPNALRSTTTWRSGSTGCSPPAISVERMIIPAHVPKIGAPDRPRRRIGSRKPHRSIKWRIVVLSPPGRIRPATSSRSAGRRTSTPSTPIAARVAMCSRKAPCTARTPIFTTWLRSRVVDRRRVVATGSGRPRSPAGSAEARVGYRRLPAPGREALGIGDRLQRDSAHGCPQALRDLGQDLRVVEMGGGLDDRVRHPGRLLALEDARAHEHAVRPQLHRECRVRGGGDPAGDEVDHRQGAGAGDLADELDRSAELLRGGEQLVLAHRREPSQLRVDGADVTDRLNDVAGARLALGTDHRRALGDPAERLAQVAAAAHERHLEGVLVDVVRLVGGRQDLGLVDVVDAERLEDLGLDEVADPGLRHDPAAQ